MANHSVVRTAAVLTVGALALSACSGGGEEAETKDRLTIAEIMGAPDYANMDQSAIDAQVQELIADCMQEEGWEYIPVKYPQQSVEFSEDDQLELIKREGLGMAYYVLNPNGTSVPSDDPWADWVDPNTEYVNSLSESELTAYYESLNGVSPVVSATTDGAVVSEVAVEQTDTGCSGEAYAEVMGNDITQTPEYWEAMQGYYDDLQTRMEADPRVKELDATWASCMKDAGFDFKSQNDFWETGYQSYQDRLTKILGEDYYKDPMEGWTEQKMNDFWATATQEQIDALYKQPEPTDDQRAQLEELLADEIKVATAQFECTKPYSEKMTTIYADIEEQFALEHEDELRALAASLAEDK